MTVTQNLTDPGIVELLNPQTGEIDFYTQVKVVNRGPDNLRWQYDSRWWEIPGTADPQGRRNFAVVPFQAMVYYCGDSRTADVPGDMRYRDRTNEFKRLCTVYGIYDNIDNKSTETDFPPVKVYTLNDTPIVTVLDDPMGDATPELVNNQTLVEQMQALILAQAEALKNNQAAIAELQRQQGIQPQDDSITLPEVEQNPQGANRNQPENLAQFTPNPNAIQVQTQQATPTPEPITDGSALGQINAAGLAAAVAGAQAGEIDDAPVSLSDPGNVDTSTSLPPDHPSNNPLFGA